MNTDIQTRNGYILESGRINSLENIKELLEQREIFNQKITSAVIGVFSDALEKACQMHFNIINPINFYNVDFHPLNRSMVFVTGKVVLNIGDKILR